MNIQKQIKKELLAVEHYEAEHRSTVVRSLSMFLIAATVFSVTGLSHGGEQRTKQNREAVAQTIPVLHTAERNETVRMPVRFSDGLRATATTGA